MDRKKLLMAAVTGLALGANAAPGSGAETPANKVKCYGVNSCGSHAKCSITKADMDATRALLGDKEYQARFGKSETHSCGSHAKCGPSSKILNWQPTSAGECHDKGGIVIEEVEGKKVAKKA